MKRGAERICGSSNHIRLQRGTRGELTGKLIRTYTGETNVDNETDIKLAAADIYK